MTEHLLMSIIQANCCDVHSHCEPFSITVEQDMRPVEFWVMRGTTLNKNGEVVEPIWVISNEEFKALKTLHEKSELPLTQQGIEQLILQMRS